MGNERNNHEMSRDPLATLARFRIVLIGFLLVIAYFLWTEHRAHIIPFLPFLLLALCPLMHVFMHHGHQHRHEEDETPKDARSKGE